MVGHATRVQRHAEMARQGDPRVNQGLANVVTHLDDVIIFDPDPSFHVLTITELFTQLQKCDLKLSPSNAKIGATVGDFLGHTISPAGIQPSANEFSALTRMPMPLDLKQLRSRLDAYRRKFPAEMGKRMRPITSILR